MTQQNSQSKVARGFRTNDWFSSLFPARLSRIAGRSLKVLAVAVSLEAMVLSGVADEGLPTTSYVRASGTPRPGFAMEIIPRAAAFKAPSESEAEIDVARPAAQARRVIVPDATLVIERGRANNTGVSLQDRAERLRAGLRGEGSGDADDVGEMAMPLIRRTAQRIGALPPVPQESTRNISVARNLPGADDTVATSRVQLPEIPYAKSADSAQSSADYSQNDADASRGNARYPAAEAAVAEAATGAKQYEPAPRITARYPEDGDMVVYDVPEWKPHSPGHSFSGELPSRNSRQMGSISSTVVSDPSSQAVARYSGAASAGPSIAAPSMAFYPPEGGFPGATDPGAAASMIAGLPDYQSLPSLPSAGYSQIPMQQQPAVMAIPQLPSGGLRSLSRSIHQ